MCPIDLRLTFGVLNHPPFSSDFFILSFICMTVLLECVFVCIPHACLVSQKSEEGIGLLGTGGTMVVSHSEGCWELNPGPLQEQQLIFTMEASLQPLYLFIFKDRVSH